MVVHPPAMREVLPEIAPHLQKNTVVISLAPKFLIATISELLNGHQKIVRMIPNAATLINKGFSRFLSFRLLGW
ncbi:MAG: pyrroline-5-carboxylate reductase family protein [bacterium]